MLTITAAALLGLVLLIFATVSAERAVRDQAARTNAVLVELRTLSRASLNAETGQRGYLLTLDARYLRPYLAARAEYGGALVRLRRSMGEDQTPRQRQLVDQIDTLMAAKFAEMGETVTLIEQGELLEARRLILTDEGQEVMERLRRSLFELERLELAVLREATGEAAEFERRLFPLLALLLTAMLAALFYGYVLVTRTVRAETEAAQAGALAEARDRADLLARELNHRVKNLFAVVLAIVRMTGKGHPEAKPVVEAISDRIRALLTAHEVTQGSLDKPVAPLRELVETTLKPYRSDQHEALVEGPDVMIPAEKATPLGLVLHEATTNAVKYGAWAGAGRIAVRWSERDGTVYIEWRESGAALSTVAGAPASEGFGSMLMRSSAQQLRGTVERRFETDGAVMEISFPIS